MHFQIPTLPALPKMPKARKATSTGLCKCGCGGTTKRTWAPGHDGVMTGFAKAFRDAADVKRGEEFIGLVAPEQLRGMCSRLMFEAVKEGFSWAADVVDETPDMDVEVAEQVAA